MSRDERRRNVRKLVDLPGEIAHGGAPLHAARVADLSIGGAFIVVDPLPPFGSAVRLRFEIAGQCLELDGVVRWTKPRGVGLQFGVLGARETYLISELTANAEVAPDSRR